MIKILYELYYSFKFSNHISKLGRYKIKPKKKNIIIVETHKLFGGHLGLSYVCNELVKEFSCKICLFKSNFFKNILEKFIHIILMKLNLFHYRIYKSFGESFYIYFNKINLPFNQYRKFLKKIKNKKDLQNFKIEGILYGDLIYDSFLSWENEHTIKSFEDEKFVDFFYKSIEYFYFCKSLFERYDVKCVILSHSVYLPAIMGRIALNKNRLFFTLSLAQLVNHSKKFPYSNNYKLYKKNFLKLPKKNQNELIKKAKIDLNKNIKGYSSEGIENLDHSPFVGTKDNAAIKKGNNLKILVASHCFTDSPHADGNFFFTDFYDWIEYLGKISLKTNYDWYIKPHPNPKYKKKNIDVIQNFIKKYKNFNVVNHDVSHFSYLNKIDYVLTLDGHIAEELSLFNMPIINGKPNGRFSNYNFSINPKSIKQYEKILLNLKKKKNYIIEKNEVYLSHCIHHFYMNQNYLIPYHKVAKKIGDNNLNSYKILKYWISNFNLLTHEKIIKKISVFIKKSKKEKKFIRLN
tara:strand:+ start:15535 stop:17091 length:1557 start_codon:yes stop_codon:yes gene_type:complete